MEEEKMQTNEQWDKFYQTGSIDDYLQYACASEGTQLNGFRKGSEQNAGNSAGNGAGSIAHWRE